jgi:hypothetical protein
VHFANLFLGILCPASAVTFCSVLKGTVSQDIEKLKKLLLSLQIFHALFSIEKYKFVLLCFEKCHAQTISGETVPLSGLSGCNQHLVN